MVSIKRVEEFLTKDEKSETEHGLERRSSLVIADTKRKSRKNAFEFFRHQSKYVIFGFKTENIVEISDVSASWDENSNDSTLQEINLNIKPGQLCAVIGPVGAGKVLISIEQNRLNRKSF